MINDSIIYIDMDGVCVDFIDTFLKRTNINPSVKERIIGGDYHRWFKEVTNVNDPLGILKEDGFYKDATPHEEVVKLINKWKMDKYASVMFVTHAVTKNAFSEKIEWLEKHFEWFDFKKDVAFTNEKHKLLRKRDIIIDDSEYVIRNSLDIAGATVISPVLWSHNLKFDFLSNPKYLLYSNGHQLDELIDRLVFSVA